MTGKSKKYELTQSASLNNTLNRRSRARQFESTASKAEDNIHLSNETLVKEKNQPEPDSFAKIMAAFIGVKSVALVKNKFDQQHINATELQVMRAETRPGNQQTVGGEDALIESLGLLLDGGAGFSSLATTELASNSDAGESEVYTEQARQVQKTLISENPSKRLAFSKDSLTGDPLLVKAAVKNLNDPTLRPKGNIEKDDDKYETSFSMK